MSRYEGLPPLDSDGAPFGLQPAEISTEPRPPRRAIPAPAAVKLNHPNHLPPAGCPLLILVGGELIRAERTSFIEKRGRQMEYRTEHGDLLVGRFEWTHP